MLLRILVALPLVGALLAVAPSSADAARPAPADLPRGVPAAARLPEATLPVPAGWPFAQALSHTAGTDRLHGGGDYWTDYVYDDHGAALPTGFSLRNTALLAPAQGVYSYAGANAHGNGADVFVAATGDDARASYWRVDFTTLADPSVPIAVWTFDTDRRTSTGASDWPAGAGVSSPGIDEALVVSSKGAWLHDLRTGTVVNVTAHGGRLTVDRAAKSFVVRVPHALMPVAGRWKVRLATGVASADGQTMAAPTISGVPLPPGATHVYNVAYRSTAQEPPVYTDGQTSALVAAVQALAVATPPLDQLGADGQERFVTGNFWNEDHQADALASGDVSAFSHVVDWAALRHRRATPDPLVRGTSVRWYASRLHLGQGVVADQGAGTGDGRPNYLSPIQPYTVYVPRHYRASRPAPLTWILHSLSVNHNQYAAYDPTLLQQLCERRGSICATTLGYGPDGWYFDEAENDYWSVWGALARTYALDPTRTVISGYSMGGWATYKLGLAHPDLYAAAVTLAGPPVCGVSVDDSNVTMPAFGGRCTTDGSSVPLIGNARWLPYRIGQGTVDELVPFTSVEAQLSHFNALGLRHLFVRYPGEDHLVFATQDRFDAIVDGLGRPQVVANPRTIDFTWQPHLDRPDLGIGATTAYWTSGLRARATGAGSLAHLVAISRMLPGRVHGVRRAGPTALTSPVPGIRTNVTWTDGRVLPIRRQLVLRLTNVKALTVDLRRARFRCGVVRVTTDGPVAVRLRGLGHDRVVRVTDARRVRLAC